MTEESKSTSNSAGLLRLSEPKFYTRLAQLRSDQGYGIGRTTLVKRWSIITPNLVVTMKINGVPIIIDGLELDGRTFDIPKIRQALRDILPETPEQNMLCAIESTLFGTQLLGTEYYRYFDSKKLFDFLFTGELCVTFVPSCSKGEIPDRVDIEEEYVISEIQLLQRLEAGETLADIDVRCKDEFIPISTD